MRTLPQERLVDFSRAPPNAFVIYFPNCVYTRKREEPPPYYAWCSLALSLSLKGGVLLCGKTISSKSSSAGAQSVGRFAAADEYSIEIAVPVPKPAAQRREKAESVALLTSQRRSVQRGKSPKSRSGRKSTTHSIELPTRFCSMTGRFAADLAELSEASEPA